MPGGLVNAKAVVQNGVGITVGDTGDGLHERLTLS